MMYAMLRSLIINDPIISGLIGDRVYPMAPPETYTLPLATYTPISDTRNAATGTHQTRVQFDLYAQSYATALQISAAIERALCGAHNAGNDETILNIDHASFGATYDAEGRIYRISADYLITWRYNK